MNRAARIGVGTFAMIVATWVLGWWAVPVVGALWGLKGNPVEPTLAAVMAWGALLGWTATTGPLLPFAARLGGVVGLPGWAMLVITVAFAALLAWSAATLVGALARKAP